MRAIKVAAAALVLSGFSVSVSADAQSGLEFNSLGSCNSYLRHQQRSASRGTDTTEAARWDAAYCQAIAFKRFVIVFPI
jgi:hypothetical protein